MSTATLNNEDIKMFVPKLRFPEFEGEWKESKIVDNLTIGNGKDYKHLENGDIPVFGTGGLMTYVNKFLYDGETVCIGRKGTIDKPMFYSGKIWTVDTLFYTHSFVSSLPKFIYNVFQRINWKEHNEASGVPSLSKSTIEKIKIFIPTLPEQQKIASFLSAVDEKIQQLSRKKKLLEQYKKGIMQQLFSGKLRFKDENGNDFADWEEKKLGDLVTLMQSGISRMLSETDIGLPIIRSNNLQNGRIDVTDIKYWFEIDNQGANLDNYLLSEGDLLVNFINSIAQIGKVARFSDLMKRKTIFTTNLLRLRFNEKVTSGFMINYFHLKKYEDFIQSITKPAVNQASFTTKDFRTFIVNLPCLEEQQKITNFLSGIDVKIESTNQQINQMQSFKKGLLQQLFV